jgi:citrate synthase
VAALTAPETAARLGVKLDTVYAYVSRGLLTARREPSSRRSLFDAQEVEILARRGRPRRSTRPTALDLVIETELTTIVEQRPRYRGRDACAMAQSHTFEEVAQWLWTGADQRCVRDWRPFPLALPALAEPRDRIRAAVIIASATDAARSDLNVAAVTGTAEALIATMVAAVSEVPERAAGHSTAERLWRSLTSSRPHPAVLNAALVLLADHELASSTLAARVAASVRADPFSVVLAGLGTIAGPLHGGASLLVHELLTEARARGGEAALVSALDAHGRLPGFGHPLYPSGDPRAKLVLELIDRALPRSTALSAAHDTIVAAQRLSRLEPNIDFALGTLTVAAHMPASAGETIFTIARTAGWIAHALEEYAEPPLRFRARAVARP